MGSVIMNKVPKQMEDQSSGPPTGSQDWLTADLEEKFWSSGSKTSELPKIQCVWQTDKEKERRRKPFGFKSSAEKGKKENKERVEVK